MIKKELHRCFQIYIAIPLEEYLEQPEVVQTNFGADQQSWKNFQALDRARHKITNEGLGIPILLEIQKTVCKRQTLEADQLVGLLTKTNL